MNLIDRIVGWADPEKGLRRHYQRRLLARAYEAASPRDTWRPRRAGASANTDHASDAATLRTKARALVQNVPYARSALDGLVAYTIGTGIVSRAIGANAEAFNNAFDRWAKTCDADGRLDWYGIQAAAYRAMEQDGEVLIRLRTRRPTDNLPIPLQLQLLEIDWLDASRHGLINGANVVNGIEYDSLGKPAAYWLWDTHPGEISMPRGRTSSQRVEASSIIHLFAPERPGQGRGFTRFASVISRVRDLQLYEDAELARKNLETRLSVLASGDVSLMRDSDPNDPQGDPASKSGDLGELAGGSIIQLPTGMQTTVIEPKAAPGYVETVKQHLAMIAAGFGVPYALMTGDLSETSFSSMRGGWLDFRRRVSLTQWHVVIPGLCERVCIAAMDAAILAGIIRRADRRFEHSTPKWEYINPEQDVKAEMLEMSAGLTPPSELARRRGYSSFDAVVAEMARDFKKMEDAGVLPILMALQGRVMPGLLPGTGAREETPPPKAEMPAVHIHTAPVHVASPTVNVAPAEVRVEATQVHVPAPIVNVAPTEVRVEAAQVNVPAPVVNVAPAHVRVEAAHVHVPAPKVDVTVTTPRRRIDGMVERDEHGRVLRTTQIERDIDS